MNTDLAIPTFAKITKRVQNSTLLPDIISITVSSAAIDLKCKSGENLTQRVFLNENRSN